jgi:hypothetical protein
MISLVGEEPGGSWRKTSVCERAGAGIRPESNQARQRQRAAALMIFIPARSSQRLQGTSTFLSL